MEILSFSLNPNGILSINIRESSVDGNSDNYINLTVEQTNIALGEVSETSRSLFDIIVDLIILYKK